MRKKISKKPSFSEVNEMTIHEILKAMEITLNNDTDEKIMERDCRSLLISWEMRVKYDVPTTRQWTYLEKKLNFITLAYAAIRKYGDVYVDWDEFIEKLGKCRYEDTNIINKPYQTICLDYDMDAFTRSTSIGWAYGEGSLTNLVLDYTNTSLSKASNHLSYITGLDKGKLKDFCDTRLLNEILGIRDIFMRILEGRSREWREKLVNEINDNIYSVPNNSMQEFLTSVGYAVKRITVADYVIFLTVIKHVSEKDHDLAIRYLTQKDDNMEYFPTRFELLSLFARTYPFNENNDRISICPQEHIFVFNNYFKPEYVYGTEDGDNALESTNNSNSANDNDSITLSSAKGTISFNVSSDNKQDKYVIQEMARLLLEFLLEDGGHTFNVYRNSDAESTATSEDNDCIAIDIEAPIKEDPVIMEQVDNLLKAILKQDWYDRNCGKTFSLSVNRHKRK